MDNHVYPNGTNLRPDRWNSNNCRSSRSRTTSHNLAGPGWASRPHRLSRCSGTLFVTSNIRHQRPTRHELRNPSSTTDTLAREGEPNSLPFFSISPEAHQTARSALGQDPHFLEDQEMRTLTRSTETVLISRTLALIQSHAIGSI